MYFITMTMENTTLCKPHRVSKVSLRKGKSLGREETSCESLTLGAQLTLSACFVELRNKKAKTIAGSCFLVFTGGTRNKMKSCFNRSPLNETIPAVNVL